MWEQFLFAGDIGHFEQCFFFFVSNFLQHFVLSFFEEQPLVHPVQEVLFASSTIVTLFLLSSQSKAGTLLSMGWNNRIKTSMGVGLATTLSLMLTDGEMQAITNVWGWAMTIALCAFLLSGFFRGLFSSVRKISNLLGR